MCALKEWVASVPELASQSCLHELAQLFFDTGLGTIFSQAVILNVHSALDAARKGSDMCLLSMQDADTVQRLEESGRLGECAGMLLASGAGAGEGLNIKTLEAQAEALLKGGNGVLGPMLVWPSLPAIQMAKECLQILKNQGGAELEEWSRLGAESSSGFRGTPQGAIKK